jgi:DNA modification methylase
MKTLRSTPQQILIHGNNIDVLDGYPDNYFDSIVTDVPYGIKFMGKSWDYGVPSVDTWRKILRVLKHGGWVLSFSSPRTYHRMAVNMEDAGFEIRDCIQWIYGQGFPHSYDISKGIDKKFGQTREVVSSSNNGAGVSKVKTKNHAKGDTGIGILDGSGKSFDITKPASPEAQQWNGYGTALKPANEPICVAMKPCEGNFVNNVLKYGVGGINIDASRIAGRFPANVIFDEVAAEVLDQQAPKTGAFAKVKAGKSGKSKGIYNDYATRGDDGATFYDDGLQGASRFFYVAKASTSERNFGLQNSSLQNTHPTVKPIKLMEYLVKLVTPPNGIVLDPYAGSNPTGIACKKLGFGYVGVEKESEYVKIGQMRMEAY